MSLFGTQKIFGTAQPSPFATGFGTTTTGTTASTTTNPTLFGGFGFGTGQTTQASSLFQTTAQKTTALTNPFGSLSSGVSPFQSFGAGVPKTTTAFPSLFSATTTSQQPSLFGAQPGLGFGSLYNPPQSTFGSLFSAQPGTTTAIAQSSQPQGLQHNSVDAFFASLCQPLLFGDERDTILARWNQLQSMWGSGTGFSSLGIAVYTPENTFARFKSVAYNLLPTSTDADGLVCLYLARPFAEVMSQRQGLQDVLFRLLGGRPNLQLIIEEIRPCAEQQNQTEVILSVVERQVTGGVTKVSASELEKYLSSPAVASQLQSQLCACKVSAEVCPSFAQLSAFKENPPAGIDRLIWQQACMDNPFPDSAVPVPLVGFADLRRRKLDQIAFNQQQSNVLKQIGKKVQELKTGQLNITQKVNQLKRKQVEISHRVLKVLRRQEVHRRSGFAIGADEEALRCGLERIWAELTSPRGLRVRFQDALSNFKLNTNAPDGGNKENSLNSNTDPAYGDGQVEWNLDADSWAELKEYLAQRQSGIRELQHLITEMSATVKVMEQIPLKPAIQNPVQPFSGRLRTTPSKVSFTLSGLAR